MPTPPKQPTQMSPKQAWAIAHLFCERYRRGEPGVTREMMERSIDNWLNVCEVMTILAIMGR